jgi:D-alanyl-D-alanine carboxypeptidase
MCVLVIFFGISFKVISQPVLNEKIENVKAEMVTEKQPESEKISFFLRQNYVLPLEQIQMPNRKAGKEDILIRAKAVLAVDDYSGEILYAKDAGLKVKIASLTKLATAGTLMDFIKTENVNLIIKDGNYSLDSVITISKAAVEAEGDSGSLVVGEKIKAGELLKIMLIASSNDAARAIAEDVSKKNTSKYQEKDYFIGLMNNFAKKEGMVNTNFTNPDGIDELNNYSTAKDMVELSRNLLKNYPEIFNITATEKINIKSYDGKINHSIKSTDRLLGKLNGIVGGKTGYTDEAGESLLLVVKDPTGQHKIVAVVIGADGRFTEMEKLVNWVWDTYEWK